MGTVTLNRIIFAKVTLLLEAIDEILLVWSKVEGIGLMEAKQHQEHIFEVDLGIQGAQFAFKERLKG